MKLNIVAEMLLVPLLLASGVSALVNTLDSPGNGQSSSVLVGSVTKGPISPVMWQGAPASSSGVANARIDIATAAGNRLISVVTDSTGNFRVKLAPGSYRLTMPSLHGAMFTKDLPAIVTIAAGEMKRVDIHLDTGIR
jgi:hypothetical protein